MLARGGSEFGAGGYFCARQSMSRYFPSATGTRGRFACGGAGASSHGLSEGSKMLEVLLFSIWLLLFVSAMSHLDKRLDRIEDLIRGKNPDDKGRH